MGVRGVIRVWCVITFILFASLYSLSVSPATYIFNLSMMASTGVVWWLTFQGES